MPVEGAIRPAMQRSRVLLPEPDLPSSATISPSWSSKSMPSSTTSGWPSGVVKFLVTPSTAMIVSPARPSPAAVVVVRVRGSHGGLLEVRGQSEYLVSARW